jgi:mannosyltransferase OCH1-like enzyme
MIALIILFIFIYLLFYFINNNFLIENFTGEHYGTIINFTPIYSVESNEKIITTKENILITKEKIPKIIIQTWKNNDIPDKYRNDVTSLYKKNPDFQFLLFTDNDIELFLKDNYPEYYVTYVKLPIKIQKIDFFRYIAIYHYGGFYFDLDMTGLLPLNDLLNYECVFPVDQNITSNKCDRMRLKKYCAQNMKILLGQYAFAAVPKHEFIKLLIDNIHNNIDKYIELYNLYGEKIQYVYSSTGPDYVTDIYINYKNKGKIHILKYDIAQYF